MNEVELTEMELEAVSGGGLFNTVSGGGLFNITAPVVTVQNNIAVPIAVAVGVGGGATSSNLLGSLTNIGVHHA